MASQPIFCSCCGAEGKAGCDCGAEYISASAFAAKAIAAHPGKSTRAIAEATGVSGTTLRRIRNSVAPNGAPDHEPVKRLGKDGKMYRAKRAGVTRRAKPEEIGDHSPKSERHIDTRTGENISRFEAIKRDGAHELEAEVIELRATVAQLNFELSQRPSMDDLRRIDSVARHVQRITTDTATYNLLRRCLHPDSRNSVSDDLLREAWLAFGKLEPLTYDKDKLPPPLPASLDELWQRKQAATEARKRKP